MELDLHISGYAPQHLGLMNVVVGLLLIGLSIPLILERVRMNDWYGMRIPKAFESDANWYAINLVGGRWMAGAGMVLTAIGALVLYWPTTRPAVLLLALAPVAIIVLMLFPIFVFARRLR